MIPRILTVADAPEVARLWYAGSIESAARDPSFRPRISMDDYAARVGNELASKEIVGWGVPASQSNNLIAYLTARIVGPSIEWEQDSHLYVLDVDVESTERRRGHARSLVRLAAEYAQHSSINRIELGWLASDPRASAVWAKLGFHPYLQRGYLELPPVK